MKQEIENIREKLAELEHLQWIDWSRNIATTEKISEERLERWSKLWRPYENLSEEEKDQDRKYADEVLKVVVEKIERLKDNCCDNGHVFEGYESIYEEDGSVSQGDPIWGGCSNHVVGGVYQDTERDLIIDSIINELSPLSPNKENK